MTNGIPAAIYDRLSTTAQAERGHAGDGHLRELREEMAATGRVVVEEVTEAGEKRFIYDRPGVRRLMELAQAGEIREVWAWSWQRYGEGSVPQRIEEDLGDFGVALRALDDGGVGLGGEILRAVGGVLSANDQRERVRKAGMGKRQKARSGRIVGIGRRSRYGFALVRDARGKSLGYEIVPEEMAVVRRVLSMLASGESIHAVQGTLQREGVPAPMGGEGWGRDTIKKMAMADVYRPHSPEELRALVAEGLLSQEVHDALDPTRAHGVEFYGKTRSRRASRRTKRRITEPAPRSEWVAVPVPLGPLGEADLAPAAATVDAARRVLEGNRKGSKAGRREWELSRGFLRCAECGRSMQAVVSRNSRGATYEYYQCPERRAARPSLGIESRCSHRRSHPAVYLEQRAASLFEENATYDALVTLYERAVREEEERLGIADPGAARETHEKLSGELEELNAERRGYLRLAAREAISDAELDDLLFQLDAKRQGLTNRLREAEEAMNARRAPTWSPVHAGWEEDPDAVQPSQVLSHASSPEDVRRAYRLNGARFAVDQDGKLTLRMEVPLAPAQGYPVSELTTISR